MANGKPVLVNLTTNPCKMCMPMGAVTAFYGIKGCMTLLHGSQGCSTYIRRHMATHYNEPIDIASSALTEHGTVYGGEENLVKGLDNLIRVYDPEVIGIATTCLAETIGEDVPRIVEKFQANHTGKPVTIITAASAGYSGTQYEGYFHALHAVVSAVSTKMEKHDAVNIITGPISPADTRFLKKLLDESGLTYILLPDLSENLDGGHDKKYEKLPEGGTSISDIARMGGSRHTLELSVFAEERFSPGAFLSRHFDVPMTRLPLPVGLRDTDAFIEAVRSLGGVFSPELQKERSRYLDAMIDAHKYNAKARAVLFGEPDFLYSMVRVCCENGIMPVVVACGTKCPPLDAKIRGEIKELSERFFDTPYTIIDDADFDDIDSAAVIYKANIMIGSSDGRRISEKREIPLIRCAFPVHDALGGQRVRILGYEGSLTLIDGVSNVMIHHTETNFRTALHQKYFKKPESGSKPMTVLTNEKKTATHPCYNCGAGKYARIHLPVAPNCNISCNYCLRKFDCPNESRPGVTTKVITPEEAFARYVEVKAKMPNLKVVGIAGPGEALDNFENTKKTLELIRAEDPEVTFCLSTNGLMLPFYAQQLIDLGVSHITVTLNAVDPEIGAKIYRYVDYLGKRYIGTEGARILLQNQLTGIRYLTSKGVMCKINVVMLKGINEDHVETVIKAVRDLGVTITNIMQMIPVKGSAFENLPLVSNRELNEMRTQCGEYVKQMFHCRQCRADAVGTLDQDESGTLFGGCPSAKENPAAVSLGVKSIKAGSAPADAARPITEVSPTADTEEPAALYRVAVCSRGGFLVDQHFGHAKELLIYENRNGEAVFVEKRRAVPYCAGVSECGGGGDGSGDGTGKEQDDPFAPLDDEKDSKMDRLLATVTDCQYVLAMRVGESPRRRLSNNGIKVVMTYDRIEKAVLEVEKLYVEQKERMEEAI